MTEEFAPFWPVFVKGSFLMPANKTRPGMTITCDKCGASPLEACLNFGDTDLCIECVAKWDREMHSESSLNPMRRLFPTVPDVGGNTHAASLR